MPQICINPCDISIHAAFSLRLSEELLLRPGATVGLFGANGCGKSTFLTYLLDEMRKNNSKVVARTEVSANVGYLPQSPAHLALPWIYPSNLRKALGMDRRASEVPFRSKTLPTHSARFANLSGGQRQLAALLSVLSYKHAFLVLDEPFSALDYFVSRNIALDIRDYSKLTGAITFISAHDPLPLQFLSDSLLLFNPNRGVIIHHVNGAKLSSTELNDFKIDAREYATWIKLTGS